MAATITGSNLILGAPADGEAFTGQAMRLGLASHATIMGGASPLVSRSGIIPTKGNPLDVQALSTTSVTVKAGTAVVQANQAGGGTHTATLTTDTVMDTITSDGTNPRIDVVVLEVIADGTGAGTVATIKRVIGTAASSPARPSIASPPTNGSWFPLAQLRVNAAGAGIVITKLTSTDGVFTTGPGGMVPVANLTEAATLPPFTPFWSIADQAHGTVYADGTARLDGHQLRFIRTFSTHTTNSNGDTPGLPFGVFFAGVFTAAPFPNGCFGVCIQDASSWVTVDTPLMFKQFGSAGMPSASTATFRVYQGGGSKYTSAGFDAFGIAWGW